MNKASTPNNFENITTCVFDAYGTLFDVHSAVAALADVVGEQHAQLSAIWRTRQLEYTWLHSMMGQHDNFWNITSNALHVSLRQLGLNPDTLHEPLMQAYLKLDAFEEVESVLTLLKRAGFNTAILTNGTPNMISSAVNNAAIEHLIDEQLSVESISVFKPDARVYQLAVDKLNADAAGIAFMSSNYWDAAGAAHFGFKVAWVNRYAQPSEALPGSPSAMLSTLLELPELLGIC